jgi:hypothetical protein
MRFMHSGLATVLLMLPVSALAQGSRAAASLAPAKPSQVVTLTSSFSATPCPSGSGLVFDTQMLPDGTSAAFAGIPAGQVFVLMGLSFSVSGGSSSEPKQVIVLSTRPPFTDGAWLFQSVVPLAGASNRGGGIAALHNAVVKSGTTLCIFSSDGGVVSGVISGFLAKDE